MDQCPRWGSSGPSGIDSYRWLRLWHMWNINIISSLTRQLTYTHHSLADTHSSITTPFSPLPPPQRCRMDANVACTIMRYRRRCCSLNLTQYPHHFHPFTALPLCNVSAWLYKYSGTRIVSTLPVKAPGTPNCGFMLSVAKKVSSGLFVGVTHSSNWLPMSLCMVKFTKSHVAARYANPLARVMFWGGDTSYFPTLLLFTQRFSTRAPKYLKPHALLAIAFHQ